MREVEMIELLREMQDNMKKIAAEMKSVREFVEDKRRDKLGFPRHWDVRTSEDQGDD